MTDIFELNRFKTILISLNEVIGDLVLEAKQPEDIKPLAEDLLAVVRVLHLELPRYIEPAICNDE